MKSTAPSRTASALAAALLAAAWAPGALAQQELSLFLDTVDVHVVDVEVIVTDAEGNPVTGLGREDFEVYEDGQRVELSNFYAVEERRIATGPFGAAGGPDAEPVTAVPGITRNLQLVVFIDNLNLEARFRNQVFNRLRETLATSLAPGDRVMLVTMGREIEVAQGLTDDREALLSALDRLEEELGPGTAAQADFRLLLTRMQATPLESPTTAGGLSNPFFEGTELDASRFAGEIRTLAERRYRRVQATAAAVGGFADSLAGLPGRKAILYLSGGLPVNASDALVEAWLGKFEQWALTNDRTDLLNQVTSLVNREFDATRHLERMVAEASANRVAFYPLSPTTGAGATGLSAEFAGAGTLDGRGAASRTVMTLEQSTREASLLTLAEGTGGVALTRSVNIDELLRRMESDFSTFYSLGYNPPHGGDGEEHRVEVRLAAGTPGDLEVRHLKSYREKYPLDRLRDLTLSALHYGVADNPLEIRLVPGEAVATGDDRYQVPATLRIPFAKLLLLPQQETHTARLSAFLVVGDDRGRVSPMQRIELPIEIPNDRILEALDSTAAYPVELEMRGGRQTIAVGVRDQLARIDATVAVELEVGATAGVAPAAPDAEAAPVTPGEDAGR